jgi:uncharacterized phiE125 gp8 family phage protein
MLYIYPPPRIERPFLSVVSQPENEPISYAQAADHLRVDSEDDIAYIEALIPVAREYVQEVTGRVGSTQTLLVTAASWESLMRKCDCILRIGRSPVQSVSFIKYFAPDGVALTIMDTADYRVITVAEPAMIQRVDGSWPSVHDRPDAIQIQFIAGHSSANPPPPGYMHAIKMLVAHLYEERKPVAFASCNEIPFTLRNLIEMQRIEGRVG